MINTQKLIIMNIIIGILIGTIINTTGMSNPEEATGTLFTNFSNQIEQKAGIGTMSSDEMKFGDVKTDNAVQENRVGNPIMLGSLLWDILTYGLIPVWVPAGIETDVISRWAYDGVRFVIFLNWILVIIELFLVYFNKKNS